MDPDILDATVQYTDSRGYRFRHPNSDEVVLEAIPTELRCEYWMSHWMHHGSYDAYKSTNATPPNAYDYAMEFSVKGVQFR